MRPKLKPTVEKNPRGASGPDREPIVLLPKQSSDVIRLRKEIRETFHDSQAKLVIGKPR